MAWKRARPLHGPPRILCIEFASVTRFFLFCSCDHCLTWWNMIIQSRFRASTGARIPEGTTQKLPLPDCLLQKGVNRSPRPQVSPARSGASQKRARVVVSDEEDEQPAEVSVVYPGDSTQQKRRRAGLPAPSHTGDLNPVPVPNGVAVGAGATPAAAAATNTASSSFLTEIVPELSCPQCSGIMVDPVVLPCSHGYW